jgi:maspardin
MTVNDESALNSQVKNEIEKYYPEASQATLKDGGNFPYVSRPAEVNVFLKVRGRRGCS